MNTYGKLIKTLVFAAVLLGLTSAEIQAQTADTAAAKREGKIVVYGTTIPNVMVPIHAAFEKRYGVKVEYWRASATAVTDRAMTEWRAGKPGFDVLFAINGTVSLLKRGKCLGQIHGPWRCELPGSI